MIRRGFALALLTIAAVTLAYQVPLVYDLDTPGVVLEGFHGVEGHGANAFRWTDGKAHIHIAGPGNRVVRLTINASGSRPSNVETPLVTVAAGGYPVGEFGTTRSNQTHTFTLCEEPADCSGSALDIWISSETFVPPNDLRTLGVAVYGLRIEPEPEYPFTWPSIQAALLSIVAVVSAGAVTKGQTATSRRREARIIRGGIPLLLLTLIAIGLATLRVLTAVALPWIAGTAVVACVAVRVRAYAGWLETSAIVATGLSFLHFVYDFLDLFRISQFTDVATMFQAAQKLAQGLDPYDYAIVRDNPLYAHSYVYPPSFAQFLSLFLPFGTPGATYVWVTLNFLLYCVVLAGLLRVFNLRPRSAAMYAFLLVAFNYRPVIDTLFGGQLDILILALLLLALLLARRERFAGSGAALGIAAMTKLHPALLLPFYFARRRWRGFAGFALALALIVAVSAALAPPDLYVSYLTIVLPGRGGESTGNPENQSLSGFLYRAQDLSWTDQPTPQQAANARLFSTGVSALLGLATFGAMLLSLYRARGVREKVDDALHLSLWVVLMLLVLPTSWMHYETQLLLPLAATLPYALDAKRRRLLVVWVIAAALTAFANQEIFRSGDFDAWPLNLIQSYKLYGVLLLWAILLRLTFAARTQMRMASGE